MGMGPTAFHSACSFFASLVVLSHSVETARASARFTRFSKASRLAPKDLSRSSRAALRAAKKRSAGALKRGIRSFSCLPEEGKVRHSFCRALKSSAPFFQSVDSFTAATRASALAISSSFFFFASFCSDVRLAKNSFSRLRRGSRNEVNFFHSSSPWSLGTLRTSAQRASMSRSLLAAESGFSMAEAASISAIRRSWAARWAKPVHSAASRTSWVLAKSLGRTSSRALPIFFRSSP
jgi:hypothetical protein